MATRAVENIGPTLSTLMTTSDEIHELAAALSLAQGEMEGAKKDAANPFFKSKYADLASVWEACRGPLAKHGLAVIQSPRVDGVHVHLDTMLTHSSGQWMRGTVSATAKDDGPQALGSVITYLRRYALQSFVGVAAEDDDAEAAQGRPVHRPEPVPVLASNTAKVPMRAPIRPTAKQNITSLGPHPPDSDAIHTTSGVQMTADDIPF